MSRKSNKIDLCPQSVKAKYSEEREDFQDKYFKPGIASKHDYHTSQVLGLQSGTWIHSLE